MQHSNIYDILTQEDVDTPSVAPTKTFNPTKIRAQLRKEIVDLLFQRRAVIFGGAVRDHFLGVEPKDYDIECTPEFGDHLTKLLRARYDDHMAGAARIDESSNSYERMDGLTIYPPRELLENMVLTVKQIHSCAIRVDKVYFVGRHDFDVNALHMTAYSDSLASEHPNSIEIDYHGHRTIVFTCLETPIREIIARIQRREAVYMQCETATKYHPPLDVDGCTIFNRRDGVRLQERFKRFRKYGYKILNADTCTTTEFCMAHAVCSD